MATRADAFGDGGRVKAPRELRGYLLKRAALNDRHWQRRFFTFEMKRSTRLRNATCLVISYTMNQYDTQPLSQGLVVDAETQVKRCPQRPCAFRLMNQQRYWWLSAETEALATLWMDTLHHAIKYAKAQERYENNEVVTLTEKMDSSCTVRSKFSLRKKWNRFTVSGTEFVLDGRYELIKVIGTGAYGVVISVNDTETKQKFAVKKISRAFEDLVDAKRIVREIKLLRHFKHPGVIGIEDLPVPDRAWELEDIYIINELMETDMHRIIYSKQELTDAHVQYFLYQILCAVKYIHSADVIHRDLKPSNILLNSNCSLKICDFGLARGVMTPDSPHWSPEKSMMDEQLSEYVVTRWYRPPELLLSCTKYTESIDVWSIGCIFAEMLGRDPLFPGRDYANQLNLIFDVIGTPTFHDLCQIMSRSKAERCIQSIQRNRGSIKRRSLREIYPQASVSALDLLERMLVFNPKRRLSIDEALRHPYVRSIRKTEYERNCVSKFHFPEEYAPLSKSLLQTVIFNEGKAFREDIVSEPEKDSPDYHEYASSSVGRKTSTVRRKSSLDRPIWR